MIYLDNAATSFYKPKEVLYAINESMVKFSANPGRSGHDLSVKAAEKVFECRIILDSFFNGYGSEFVSFTSNCTSALNTVIKGILKKGDHVVISSLEHNSVVRPIHKLSETGLIEYSVFKVFDDEDLTAESFKNTIKKNTKLCMVTCVSNVFGHILPLKRLSDIAHENGAYFFVDGAQGAGVIDLNMKEQGIDCLCIPGHKGLLGPMGIGAILHNNLKFDTLTEGGTGTNSFDLFQPTAYPERLESGTLNVPGICGLKAGVGYIENKDKSLIYKQESELAKRVFDGLKTMKNVVLYQDKYDLRTRAPVVSFNVKNMHSEQVSAELNKHSVAVRGGFQCAPFAHAFMGTNKTGTVRVSPSFFNTKKDINILLNLVEKIAFINYI